MEYRIVLLINATIIKFFYSLREVSLIRPFRPNYFCNLFIISTMS